MLCSPRTDRQTHRQTHRQTDRHESEYRGHPFRVSGIFPSTYHQGSVQLFVCESVPFSPIFIAHKRKILGSKLHILQPSLMLKLYIKYFSKPRSYNMCIDITSCLSQCVSCIWYCIIQYTSMTSDLYEILF